MPDQETETITFELPLKADDHVTVDALFTALDHACAYHDHDENNAYVTLYNLLNARLYAQAREQLDE